MNFTKSKDLFSKAKEVIPGGVNSPVRAFRSVGGDPLFIASAKGAYLQDVDGNSYIDMINSWGPMILGHAHEGILDAVREASIHSLSFGAPTEREVEMATLITQIAPNVDKVRMVNSGTEATMSAIRLARGFTGRDKILKFEGCYHGHGDSFLIAAGSGALTFGVPDSPGVTKGTATDTLTARYNDLQQVEDMVKQYPSQIAAIILEPVVGNMGCVLPNPGFLEGLRTICDQEGILLIFDEVMTGFRLALGGAQELYGIRADLVTYGKIIGGGMPVGAYGGRKDVMEFVSPAGPVYQAGTLSGNPIAMAAGLTMLKTLRDTPNFYTELNRISTKLVNGIAGGFKAKGLDYSLNHQGSMYSFFFTKEKVVDLETAKTSDTTLFAKYFRLMLENGVYLAPSQFEAVFVSAAITDEIADTIIEANRKSLDILI